MALTLRIRCSVILPMVSWQFAPFLEPVCSAHCRTRRRKCGYKSYSVFTCILRCAVLSNVMPFTQLRSDMHARQNVDVGWQIRRASVNQCVNAYYRTLDAEIAPDQLSRDKQKT